QVVITTAPNDQGGLDRAPGRGALGERMERVVRARSVLVELDHLDAAPEAPEREVRFAGLVEHQVGIDRVPVVDVRSLVRADHRAMIRPLTAVERGPRRVPDARAIAAER